MKKRKELGKVIKRSFREQSFQGTVLSQADIITNIPCTIDKDLVRESISKIKNGKAAELSGVVPEMVKTA